MSAGTTSWLDRLARRAAGAHPNRAPRARPPDRGDRLTRAALLAGRYDHSATLIADRLPTSLAMTAAGPSISRRTTLKLAAAATAASVLLKPAPARALASRSECASECDKARDRAVHTVIAHCGKSWRVAFRGFSTFLAIGFPLESALAIDMCVVGVLAQATYNRDACIADCEDTCHPGPARDAHARSGACRAFFQPVKGAQPPPPQDLAFAGCGCVGGDTCCGYVDLQGRPTGICCIYDDCRCVPR